MTAAVALVGGGPGEAELLTLRAEGLLRLAAAVVADESMVALAAGFAASADVIAVGDARPAVDQLLAAVAGAAGPVVRLYRGDPWLHPSFGTERAALERAGIGAEAVAGVAVELALPALAGVPVHVRRLAVTCTLAPAGALPPATDPSRTLVGCGADPVASAQAMAGSEPTMPVGLVPLDDPQAAWRGPLAAAGDAAASMHGPALLVAGAVCALPAEAGVVAGAVCGPPVDAGVDAGVVAGAAAEPGRPRPR